MRERSLHQIFHLTVKATCDFCKGIGLRFIYIVFALLIHLYRADIHARLLRKFSLRQPPSFADTLEFCCRCGGFHPFIGYIEKLCYIRFMQHIVKIEDFAYGEIPVYLIECLSAFVLILRKRSARPIVTRSVQDMLGSEQFSSCAYGVDDKIYQIDRRIPD